jgi:single-strand DNA-binding protein
MASEGLNRVMLLGNLGADPELRMTNGGQAVLKLRLATSETYLDRNKARQERTDWHSIVVWGKRAEGLAKILSKGSRIFVEGRLQTSTYDDRDGNKRYRTEVVANNILLAGGAGRGGAGGGGGGGGGGFREAPAEDGDFSESYRPQSGAPQGGGGGADFPETEDDDIPF